LNLLLCTQPPMRHPLHLAIAALLLLAAAAPAQIHSPQVNLHRRHPADDISWLAEYTRPTPDGDENRLVQDPRFKPFLKRNLTAPQTFWGPPGGEGKPLADAAFDFLAGPPGRVILDARRYLNADACVAHFCPNRGLLWIDTALPQPLVVFAAIDWISDNRATDDKSSSYTLWIFPNQPLDPARIPAALTRSIARWTSIPSSGSTDLQNITRVFLVDPDGAPHTLSPSSVGAHNNLPAETTTASPTSTPQATPAQTAPKANP